MAYLDPASNPGSKPQRLGATNCKSSTSDKLQTFRTIFGISCKFLTKNYLHELTLFVLFRRGISCREYFYSVIFEISDKQRQFAELKNTPKKKKKTDALITLINQSQEIWPQGLDLGRSTASNQAIANLRPQPRF